MKRSVRLARSIWECRYHVVWINKYRGKQLYGISRDAVEKTIERWASIKEVEILEGHVCRDHIRLCLSIPPKYSATTIQSRVVMTVGSQFTGGLF